MNEKFVKNGIKLKSTISVFEGGRKIQKKNLQKKNLQKITYFEVISAIVSSFHDHFNSRKMYS
jgi:hypothetical protein